MLQSRPHKLKAYGHKSKSSSEAFRRKQALPLPVPQPRIQNETHSLLSLPAKKGDVPPPPGIPGYEQWRRTDRQTDEQKQNLLMEFVPALVFFLSMWVVCGLSYRLVRWSPSLNSTETFYCCDNFYTPAWSMYDEKIEWVYFYTISSHVTIGILYARCVLPHL